MRKLESDIRKAVKMYNQYKSLFERAQERLVGLKVLEAAQELDDANKLKIDLRVVTQYGAYLSGARMAFLRIGEWYFSEGRSMTRDDVLHAKATIDLAVKSKLNTDRVLDGDCGVRYSPVKDGKGRIVGYEARFYRKLTLIQEL